MIQSAKRVTANRHGSARLQALRDLQQSAVLMLDGHFDYGNGYHGRVYLNSQELFRQPSTTWRFVQDLLDLVPRDVLSATEIAAGPVTGGALLAHAVAGLLDGRRGLGDPVCSFAPFTAAPGGGLALRPFHARHMAGRQVLLCDDVRNTGTTFERCAELVRSAGGVVIGTIEIYDRQEAVFDAGVPNFALVEYRASENFPSEDCPLCKAGVPVAIF